MEKRISQGMARGNAMNTHIATMVTLMHQFSIPLQEFTASYREQRTPKVMTLVALCRKYPLFRGHEDGEAKACLSALNTSRPHLALFAQKILELDIDLDGYEWPCAHPGVGLTPADVTGIHRPTGTRVILEVKTGGGEYTLLAHGHLRQPYQSAANCIFNHHLLQLAYTFDWAKRSYPKLASTFSVPLLIRVTTENAYHYPLPSLFRSPPPPALS